MGLSKTSNTHESLFRNAFVCIGAIGIDRGFNEIVFDCFSEGRLHYEELRKTQDPNKKAKYDTIT